MTQKYSIGIDEVGRGPVAGPVSVGIVVMPVSYDLEATFSATGLTDSKKMSQKGRERVHALATELVARGDIQFGVYSVPAHDIDVGGIEQALRTAVQTGLKKLAAHAQHSEVLLDGRLKAPKEFVQRSIIGGDLLVPVISLASVVAKVERDRYMTETAHTSYPAYGFDRHKGYGTKAHLDAIRSYGYTPIHRRSFLTNVVVESSHTRN